MSKSKCKSKCSKCTARRDEPAPAAESPPERPALTAEQQALALTCKDMAHKFAADSLRRARLDGQRVSREDEEDAHAEALAAVLWAAYRFDPSRGTKFTTLAWPSLMHAMSRTPERLARGARETPFSQAFVPPAERWLAEDVAEGGADADAVDAADDAALVARLLDRVGGREALVLRLRHMEGMTLAAIGERLGVSKERVRQLEERAMGKARELMGVGDE